MRIISLKEYPAYKPDIEFKADVSQRFIAMTTVGIALIAILVATRYPIHGFKFPNWWGYTAVGMLGLLFLGLTVAYRKSLRSTNWLFRSSGTRQWIKFRSFLNDHLPADDPQVIELDRKDVAWVRPVKMKAIFLSSISAERAATQTQTIKYLDIGLNHIDTSELQAALQREEQHEGSGKYGIRTKSISYPVHVPEPGIIRLCWSNQYGRITPGIDRAIEFFARWTRTQEAQTLKVDYRPQAIAELPEQEQLERFRQLYQIDRFAAQSLVRELKKYSTTQAMESFKEV